MHFNPSISAHWSGWPPTREATTLESYHLHEQKLSTKSQNQYLGVTINQHRAWSEHIHSTAGKGNKAAGFRWRYFRHCTPAVKAAAYKTIVRPAIQHASTAWDPHSQRDITVLERHISAAKDMACSLQGTVLCSLHCMCTKKWILSSHMTWLRQGKLLCFLSCDY